MPEKEAFHHVHSPASAGLPLQFPSAFAAFHAPLPVDQRTHEGRYIWDPSGRVVHPGTPTGAFHHPAAHGWVLYINDLLPNETPEPFLYHVIKKTRPEEVGQWLNLHGDDRWTSLATEFQIGCTRYVFIKCFINTGVGIRKISDRSIALSSSGFLKIKISVHAHTYIYWTHSTHFTPEIN
jgi:hypothetical protein